MKAKKEKVALPGSGRLALPSERMAGRFDPRQLIRVSVVLRPRSPPKKEAAIKRIARQAPQDRTYITREQLAARYGATPEDVALVEAFARENALDIVQEDRAKRTVVLSGTVSQFCSAFGVSLMRYRHPSGSMFHVHSGPISVPAYLAPVVQAVLGLDNRPQARTHFRLATKRAGRGGVSFYPPQIAELYGFPKGVDGSGQSVGILEFGGGYSAKDLQAYFSGLGIDPTPNVLSVSVDNAGNSPTGDPSGPDAEVALDIEIVGSIAPKADIYVYFAPNTDAGFIDAVTAAVHDTQHHPSVISISWGGPESSWAAQSVQALEQAFQDAMLVGVTVTAASGDNGSSDGLSDGLAHVDFPASSESVLGCGGTRITTSPAKDAITTEVVWNDMPSGGASGGGISDLFSLPAWQAQAKVPPSANPGGRIGRGVPDVSGDADPNTGYMIQTDGKKVPIGGTSAVAPLWAALVALVNQSAAGSGRKPVGFINQTAYATSGDFRDVTLGDNGSYSAGTGWDACTGLGSPEGTKLLEQLIALPPGRSW
jgi:kumamolisin